MIIKNFKVILEKAIEDKFKIVVIRFIKDNGKEFSYTYKNIMFVSRYGGDLFLYVTKIEECQTNCRDIIKRINDFNFFNDMGVVIQDLDFGGLRYTQIEDIIEYEHQIEILVKENK